MSQSSRRGGRPEGARGDSRTYVFHPAAQADLVETISYYEMQALGLGEQLSNC